MTPDFRTWLRAHPDGPFLDLARDLDHDPSAPTVASAVVTHLLDLHASPGALLVSSRAARLYRRLVRREARAR